MPWLDDLVAIFSKYESLESMEDVDADPKNKMVAAISLGDIDDLAKRIEKKLEDVVSNLEKTQGLRALLYVTRGRVQGKIEHPERLKRMQGKNEGRLAHRNKLAKILLQAVGALHKVAAYEVRIGQLGGPAPGAIKPVLPRVEAMRLMVRQTDLLSTSLEDKSPAELAWLERMYEENTSLKSAEMLIREIGERVLRVEEAYREMGEQAVVDQAVKEISPDNRAAVLAYASVLLGEGMPTEAQIATVKRLLAKHSPLFQAAADTVVAFEEQLERWVRAYDPTNPDRLPSTFTKVDTRFDDGTLEVFDGRVKTRIAKNPDQEGLIGDCAMTIFIMAEAQGRGTRVSAGATWMLVRGVSVPPPKPDVKFNDLYSEVQNAIGLYFDLLASVSKQAKDPKTPDAIGKWLQMLYPYGDQRTSVLVPKSVSAPVPAFQPELDQAEVGKAVRLFPEDNPRDTFSAMSRLIGNPLPPDERITKIKTLLAKHPPRYLEAVNTIVAFETQVDKLAKSLDDDDPPAEFANISVRFDDGTTIVCFDRIKLERATLIRQTAAILLLVRAEAHVRLMEVPMGVIWGLARGFAERPVPPGSLDNKRAEVESALVIFKDFLRLTGAPADVLDALPTTLAELSDPPPARAVPVPAAQGYRPLSVSAISTLEDDW